MKKFVWLKANKKEGWKREQAELLGRSGSHGTLMVRVAPAPHDDGLREITKNQIEKETTMKTKQTSKTNPAKVAAASTKTRTVRSMDEHAAKALAFIGKRKSVPRADFVTFMKKYAPAVYSTLAKKLEKAGYIVRKAEEVKRGRKMEALAA